MAIASRSRENIDATASEIGAAGLVWDRGDQEGAANLVAGVEAALGGPVEVLLCNATGARPPHSPVEKPSGVGCRRAGRRGSRWARWSSWERCCLASDHRLISMADSEQAVRDATVEEVRARRPGTAEELATVAEFLCSERASYVTGAASPVDGGLLHAIRLGLRR